MCQHRDAHAYVRLHEGRAWVTGGASVSCIVENGEPWFKAKDAATVLKYKDTDDAIRQHVAHDDKRQQGSLI